MKRDKYYFIVAIFLISFASSTSIWSQSFTKDVFVNRRQILMEKIKDGIAVFQNYGYSKRTNDTYYYPFRSNSNFYYLSGFEEPDAAFLLIPGEEKKFIMFVKPKNAMSSMWYGEVPGIEGAMQIYGADTAYALNRFSEVLQYYLQGKKKIYYDIQNEELGKVINVAPEQAFDVNDFVYEMRVIKDSTEIKLIRKAVEISCKAHLEAMKAIQPGMFEYEIAAIFSYIFETNGSHSKAYESLVSAGVNSTIYHYSSLIGKAEDGDMVLMDMGAEFNNYASDITRVVPANGKFTKEQREIYEIALAMHDAVIANMKPGNTLRECSKISEEIAKEGLFKLDLITDRNTDWQHYLFYYPFIGHPIGLDVHDVGLDNIYSKDSPPLEPGMVFAIEPSVEIGENLVDAFRIYVAKKFSISKEEIDSFLKEIKPVFEKYKKIGVYVEDDILITGNGNEVLSADLPRTVTEIEKVMSEKSFLNRE